MYSTERVTGELHNNTAHYAITESDRNNFVDRQNTYIINNNCFPFALKCIRLVYVNIITLITFEVSLAETRK